MSDCSKHKKDLFGQTDMKLVAEAIGDLNYETLAEFLHKLSIKLYIDSVHDKIRKRNKLSYFIQDASGEIEKASIHVRRLSFIQKAKLKI